MGMSLFDDGDGHPPNPTGRFPRPPTPFRTVGTKEPLPTQAREIFSPLGLEFAEEFAVLQGIYGVECVQNVHPFQNQRRQEVRLVGGKAHGITNGAEFTLYESPKALWDGSAKPLGVMIARQEDISIFSTTLEPIGDYIHFEAPEAIAIQTKVVEAIAVLSDEGLPDHCSIKVVGKAEAQLEIIASEEGFMLNVLDVYATEHGLGRLPQTIDRRDIAHLSHILRAIAQYHLQLSLVRPNPVILNGIVVQFFPLKEECGEDGRSHPEGENMFQNGMIELRVDARASKTTRKKRTKMRYGMKIRNHTFWDFHFACFYFDHVNFSITPLTDIPEHYQTPHPIKRGSSFEIGYGNSVLPPLVFNGIPEGLNVTLGFLKFHFFHFPHARHANSTAPFSGTLKIPVVQRRKLFK
ncbi:hypothetical protein EST38_g9565 [Candolleomyces aberdarensis]|uniref:Uncharacterized protein n=1 Tax=Candolleomyces aberdarensis TaxID=2316362 RepID=A0A4Q2DBY3_9AGAR|nr:hypothetical protein EST38_g9565 [Candolleomyces aberdarensis]